MLPPDAAKILTKSSDIATKVSGCWQQDDFEAARQPLEHAVKLFHQLASKLTDETQKRVVKYLFTPWVRKFAQILKSKEGTKDTIITYYTVKNYILRAMFALDDGDQC